MKPIRMLKEFRDELKRAERKFPTFPKDVIHAAAIVQEEAGELVRAALQHTYEGGSAADVYKEAVHTGAMALRLLLNFEHLISRCSEECGSAEYSPQQINGDACPQCYGSGRMKLLDGSEFKCDKCDGVGKLNSGATPGGNNSSFE